MPSLSLLWSVGSLAVSSLVAPALATASGNSKQSYQLQEDWHGKKFLEYFEFFDQPDPTNGFVTYVNQSYAESSGLFDITDSGSLYMGVDYQTKLSPNGPGRESVRIESKEFYREGLYLIDIKHMPGSVCGTWPAFWSVGPSWPEDGEIDIIEGVNKHDANKIVLHTSGSCDVSGDHDMTGSMTSGECGEASGTIGCVVEGQKGSSGDPFNKQGGGVYAMEWTPKFIKIWFFPRSSIPTSIEKGHPDPSQFGTPMAHLQGTCNFHERFTAQKFILNTAFCGDWAGGVFGESGCPVSDASNPMQSCVNYVAENPAAFKEAYWEIDYIKLFELGTSKPEPTSVVQVSSTSTSAGGVTSIQSATSVSKSEGGVSTSLTQIISSTETQRTEAPVVPSNTADVEPTKVPQQTEGPKHTAAPSDGSGSGSGSNDHQDQDGEEDEESERSTVWVTSTSTYCPRTNGGSIATAPPGAAKHSTEVEVAVPSATSKSHVQEDDSGDNTVPVVVPTAPAVSEPAPQPTDISAPPAEGVSPEGETPEGSHGESSIEVKPPPTASTGIPVGNTRPPYSSGTPSPSGFVPVPTHVAGVPHGTTGSAPSATTPSSPMFTGAASSLSVGMTGIMGALAMALFA